MASLLFVVVWFAGSDEGATSIIKYRTLVEVLSPSRPVVCARLCEQSCERFAGSLRWTYKVAEVEVVFLRGPRSEQLVHEVSTLLERKVGERTVRVSPIRDGSGREGQLHIGERYLFVLDEAGQRALRVELLESRGEIEARVSTFKGR